MDTLSSHDAPRNRARRYETGGAATRPAQVAAPATTLPVAVPVAPSPVPVAAPARRKQARGESLRYPATDYHAAVRDLPPAERPRERLLAAGARVLSNAELIAILLRTGTAGTSVLQVSARLLAEFDGLRGLANASVAELCALRGISETKACQLLAALELGRRSASLGPADQPLISTPEDVDLLLRAELAPLAQEKLYVLLLNTKQELLRVHEVYQGTVNSASVRIAEVLRPAIKDNCPNIIVVHNHPSGDPGPSADDIRVTRRLARSAEAMDICLHDHVVIAAAGFVSMKRRGLGFDPVLPE